MFEIKNIDYKFKASFMSLGYVKATHNCINGGEKEVKHYIIQKPDAVCLTMYDPVSDEFVFVQQFRTGPALHKDETNPWLIEPVAGHIDGVEDPKAAAKREGEEETDFSVSEDKLQFLCKGYTTPGCNTEIHHHYFAYVDSSTFDLNKSHGIDDEDIKVIKLKRKLVMDMIETCDIRSCNTILGVSMAIAKGLVKN